MPQFVQTEQQKELINSLVQDLPVYRKKMHMSQADLAEAVGKSRQKISEMERGAAPLGWDTYLAILLVLGAHGVLEPRGRDAEPLIFPSKKNLRLFIGRGFFSLTAKKVRNRQNQSTNKEHFSESEQL